jgi:hypothetical protein
VSIPNRFGDDPAFALRVKRRSWRTSAQQALFTDVLRAAELAHRQGLPVTPDTVLEQGIVLAREDVVALWELPKFQQALDERGIPAFNQRGLTAQQLAALTIYVDMTVPRSHAQKLRAAGVTQKQWSGWLRIPAFEAELAFLSEQNLRDAIPIAKQRLAEQIDAGNLKSIEFALELTGVHDRRGNPVDVPGLMRDVFNILDESGVAPEVMQAIAAKIRLRLETGAPAPMVLQATPAREVEEAQ